MLANRDFQIADLSSNVERLHQLTSGIDQPQSIANVSNVVPQAPKRTAGEVAMIPMGDLFVYEVMLGFCFVTIIMNWIFI